MVASMEAPRFRSDWKFLCLAFPCVFVVVYLSVCSLLFPILETGDPIPSSSISLDENADPSKVLADFYAPSKGSDSFFFGVGNSAGQVEDNLNDSWIDLARGDLGKIRAWKNAAIPEDRLRFWSEPDVDIRLAAEAGLSVFRLSFDWGRIVPTEPIHGTDEVVDWKAVERYQYILNRVHEHGMKVMLTIFHFALPKWADAYGGWSEARTVQYYLEFTMLLKEHFAQYVDYWVTFNEPNVYVISTHCTGTFPSNRMDTSLLKIGLCFAPFGAFHRAMEHISVAHCAAYKLLTKETVDSKGVIQKPAPVGVAHLGAVVRPYGLIETPGAILLTHLLSYQWIDRIGQDLDFCGLNYYGREVGSMIGVIIDSNLEYSEAGRGIFPNGLFEVLTAFHNRYKTKWPKLRYMVTENGIADGSDSLRRPYILEHLLAIAAARTHGVPVDGYIHWTLSDNFEWIDGYCPKFGLVAVDRSNNLTRVPRDSFRMLQEVTRTGIITAGMRNREWNLLQTLRKNGVERRFCRPYDGLNRAGIESSDTPFTRPFSKSDWRFGSPSSPGYVEYSMKSIRLIGTLLRGALLGIKSSRVNLAFAAEETESHLTIHQAEL